MDMMESLNSNDVNFIERFLHAFKMLGGSELGVIDFDHFKQILEQENSADAKEILDLIKTENHVKDNKLDFVSLCSSILSIKGIFNSALENGKVAIQGPGINSRTFTRNKGSAKTSNSPYEKTISTQKSLNKFLKGVLFHVDGDMLSYRYQMEVLENTVIEIFVTAITDKGETTPNIPVEVLIFQDGKNKTLVTSSSFLNEDGFCTLKYALKKGKYILIPILLKWNMLRKSNSFDSLNLDSLIHVEEDSSVILTSACERSLKTIFDCIDLDENGLLNPTEFDYFIRHVSGETAAEEWNTVEDNFKTENQQLTFEGFVELYRLVLQTDPTDVMSMLQHMGMNETLELENALPFRLAVKSISGKFNLQPLPVSSYKEVAEKVLRKVAVEQGVSKKVRNMNDLFVFIHRLPYRATLVIQNQSHSRVKIRLDCSKSVNCESHYGRLDFTFNVLPRTCITGHHLFPVDPSKEWTVECTEHLL